ncbi:hypothetical protein K457DRAFT_25969 [Linnemannia elongata AG-77]|uniref:Uncharacterized protein n=1 Tax=Linnemannia elongata AG-77 TaxID=1314771 RepID=A0A197JBV0_9FUNG|nr:hypothetical protein K457DRAFT_25969 [Linnemannia elongata AG-77]
MFPSRDLSRNGAHKFCDVGIVEVDNISIAWPKRSHRDTSNPLAELVEYEVDEESTNVLHLKAIRPSMYTAADQILEPATEYTIVAAGRREYRGDRRWHFITKCGLKVRAGNSLHKIWTEWRVDYLEGPQRAGSVTGVPFMTFRAIRTVRSRGTDDIKCERV